MKRNARKSIPRDALMYFDNEKVLCVTPLKFIVDGENCEEGEWVEVFIPKEKEKGKQKALIVKISGK